MCIRDSDKVVFHALTQFLALAQKEAIQNREVGDLRKSAIKECADKIRTLQKQNEQHKASKLRLYEKYAAGSITKEAYIQQKACLLYTSYSGVSFNRPQFKKLEEAIRKGALDCIVVKDLSRFSRNYIDGGRYIEKIFPQLGIRFIAINDAYDSLTGDPQSDSFVIPFKNLINDSYCKDISMKIRSSLEVKQKSGEFVGSFAPYGYMKSPENKNQLIVDEAVSEYVQMIFSMYKDGFSIGRIAKRLNQMGVLSPMEYKHSAGVKFDTVFKTCLLYTSRCV